MRAESRLGAVLRFWALRPRFWVAPVACWALACWLPGLLRETNPAWMLFPVVFFGAGVALWVRSLLDVTDPARAVHVPGWVRPHRRVAVAVGVVAAVAATATLIRSGDLLLLPAAGFVVHAAAVAVTLGGGGDDAASDSRREGTITATALLAVVLPLSLLSALHWQAVPVEDSPAEAFASIARGWTRYLAGRLPLFTFGLLLVSVGLIAGRLLVLENRSRRLFRTRPAPPTRTVRRITPPPPAEPVVEPHEELDPKRARWMPLPRPPRTTVGRALLFTKNARVQRLLLVWLAFCPLCVGLQLRQHADRGPDAPFGTREVIGLAVWIGCLLSAAPALRLSRATAEARSLPRAMLLPRTRARALRSRWLTGTLGLFGSVFFFVLFFASMQLTSPAEPEAFFSAVGLLVSSLLWLLTLLLWNAAARYGNQFRLDRLRKGLLAGLFAALLVSAWLAVGPVSAWLEMTGSGSEGPDWRILGVLLVTIGVGLNLALLRRSRRWDLTTR